MPHRFVGAVAMAALLAAPSGAPQTRPTFKARVDYVEVDATVTDKAGRPVADLSKDDFTVYEDGKPLPVEVLSYVDIPVDLEPGRTVSSGPPLPPPDVATNAPFDGRVFLIVMDDRQVTPLETARARRAAEQFVEQYVGAHDLVGVVGTGARARLSQPLTSNTTLVMRAIGEIAGHRTGAAALAAEGDSVLSQDAPRGLGADDLPAPMAEVNKHDRYEDGAATLDTLARMAGYLGGIRGRRKALVWISEGVNYQMDNPDDPLAKSLLVMRTRAIAEANRNNVTVYGVDPRGLDHKNGFLNAAQPGTIGSLAGEARLSQDSLQTVSDQTGGFATVNFNNFDSAFAHIVRDNSSYYVLGYYPPADTRDGKPHTIDVRVSRPNLSVRAHKEYVVPLDSTAAEKANREGSASPALTAAMGSPMPVGDLPMRVAAAAFRQTNAKASLALTIELDVSKLPFAESNGAHTDALEISVLAANQDGKLTDGGHDHIDLALRRNYEAVRQDGMRIERRLETPPGRYRILVGVREANGGLIGTVPYDLDVPDFGKSDVSISGIVLTSQSASRIPTARPDPAFKGVLPAATTALRVFPRTDTVTLLAELYDNRKPPHASLTVRTSVVAESGAEVFSASEERAATSAGARYIANIPLAHAAPGRYVLRVTAAKSKDGKPVVERAVVFRVTTSS